MDVYKNFEKLNLIGKMGDRGLATYIYTIVLINLILTITLSNDLFLLSILIFITLIHFHIIYGFIADNEFNLYRFQHLGYEVCINSIMINIVIALGVSNDYAISKIFLIMAIVLIYMKFKYVIKAESDLYSEYGNVEYQEIVQHIKKNKEYLYVLQFVFSSLLILQIYVYTTLESNNFVAKLVYIVILFIMYNFTNLYTHNKQPVFHNLLIDKKDYVTLTLAEQVMYEKTRENEQGENPNKKIQLTK